MKCVVIDIAASKGGALTILKEFYNYIRENDTENEWIFLLSDNYIESTYNIKVIVVNNVKKNWMERLKFDFFVGKNLINNINADVVLSLQNTIVFGVKAKQIVYIHQSLPFQRVKKFSLINKHERLLAIYQYFIGLIIKVSAKKADKIIVQTNWMKNAISNTLSIIDNKIAVIPPNIIVNKKYKLDYSIKNMFFYPAGNMIYKNHQCIIEACNILENYDIDNFKIELTLDDNYNDIEYNDKRIELLGILTRDEVLYKLSKSILIFPSYMETFGLPLAEARKYGGIILASDCDFSKEILKDYENAYFFDPFKPKELASLMKKIICNEIIYNEIKEREGYLEENTWGDLVNKCIEIAKLVREDIR